MLISVCFIILVNPTFWVKSADILATGEVNTTPTRDSFSTVAILRNKVTNRFGPLQIRDSSFQGSVTLEKLHALTGYRLIVRDGRTGMKINLHIKYPVYRFDAADINQDGNTDILVGVVKTTHFDPHSRRRLFILQISNGLIKPLWLGSRVCLRLIDFKCIQIKRRTHILTIEQDQNGSFCNGIYQWQNFGLQLNKYKNENSNYATALKYFADQTN